MSESPRMVKLEVGYGDFGWKDSLCIT
jgi:hypothetical protein